MKKSIFLILLALFSGAVFAQAAPTQGVLDSILAQFTNASVGQMNVSQGYAKQIFGWLVVFDLCLFGIKKIGSSGDLSDLLGGITNKVFSWGFFYTLIVMGPQWIPLITQSFMEIGTKIGGGTQIVTPSEIMTNGQTAALSIWEAYKASSSGGGIGTDIIVGLSVVVSIIFTLVGFALITFQLLATKIELLIVSSIGFFQLGMSGASFTMQFAEKYFGYLMSTGLKLVVICVMAAFGPQLAQILVGFIGQMNTGTINPLNILSTSLVMVIYGALALQIPAVAASMMSGAPSLSAGSMAGGAAAIAGGVAGAAMAGAGAAAGLYGAGKSGLEAGKSALDKLTSLTGAGAGLSSAGDNFDYLASLSDRNDGIGKPSASNFNASSESGKPSTFNDGLNKMSDAQSKMASQEGGGGSGISIRFNHLGD